MLLFPENTPVPDFGLVELKAAVAATEGVPALGVGPEDVLVWSVIKDEAGRDLVSLRTFFVSLDDALAYADRLECCVVDHINSLAYFQTELLEAEMQEIRVYSAGESLVKVIRPTSTPLTEEAWFLGTVIGCSILLCILLILLITCCCRKPRKDKEILPLATDEGERRGRELEIKALEDAAAVKAEAAARAKAEEEARKRAQEEARKQALEEAERKRRQQEALAEEARKRAEEEAARAAAEEARRAAEEAAARQAAVDAARREEKDKALEAARVRAIKEVQQKAENSAIQQTEAEARIEIEARKPHKAMMMHLQGSQWDEVREDWHEDYDVEVRKGIYKHYLGGTV